MATLWQHHGEWRPVTKVLSFGGYGNRRDMRLCILIGQLGTPGVRRWRGSGAHKL
jgi:hypothetical protein